MGKDVKVGLGLCLVIGVLLFLIYGVGRQPEKEEASEGETATSDWFSEFQDFQFDPDNVVNGVAQGGDEEWQTGDVYPPTGDETGTSGDEEEPEFSHEEEKPPRPIYRPYVVAKGDSLWKIAEVVYGRGQHWKRILEANRDNLKDANSLKPGAVLTIPSLSSQVAEDSSFVERQHITPAGADTYVVKRGDTLTSISRQFYGTERHWKKIWQANQGLIRDPNVLKKGWKLTLPKLANPAT